MKNKTKNLIAGIGALIALALPAKAENPVSGDLSVTGLNKYIFRGMTLSKDPVIQPSFSLTKGPLTATALGNYDFKSRKLNEADALVNLSFQPVKNLNLSLGYELLTFPNTELKNTQALTSSINYNSFGQPTLSFVHNFKEGKGSYAEFSLSHDVPLNKKIKLSSSATLTFNDHYFRENSGLSHLILSTSLPIPLSKSLTLKPTLSYQQSLDKRDIQNNFFGGLGLSLKF